MKKILVLLTMLLGTVAFAQKHTVTGQVMDDKGQPAIGITVL